MPKRRSDRSVAPKRRRHSIGTPSRAVSGKRKRHILRSLEARFLVCTPSATCGRCFGGHQKAASWAEPSLAKCSRRWRPSEAFPIFSSTGPMSFPNSRRGRLPFPACQSWNASFRIRSIRRASFETRPRSLWENSEERSAARPRGSSSGFSNTFPARPGNY